MDIDQQKLEYAARATQILRPPKQTLATFGTTNVYYYLVTEPAYTEFAPGLTETVIREGRVIAERPRIVTPYYLSRLDGFSPDARKYFEMLIQAFGPGAPGLFYTYKNEPKELNIVSDNLPSVVEKLNAEIDKKGDPLASIIRGQDELWDVSLLRFIYELTRGSAPTNFSQLGARGLLHTDPSGLPADARIRIEDLFRMVQAGDVQPGALKEELDRWNVFDEYEDRFLAMFRGGR